MEFGWLGAPVAEWHSFDEHQVLEKFVKSTVVVNYDAERGYHLATTHGGILTHDEDNQQVLFHTIKHHQKACPTVTKKNLKSMDLD